jgi:putative nucleic acid modification protein with dual OB domain
LDLIDIPLLATRPRLYQRENWLLDPQQSWQRVGQATWPQVAGMAESPETLWVNGSSTYHGLNDQISLEIAEALTNSLYLVCLPAVRLRVFRPNANFGDPRLRVQGQFEYRGQSYWLRITDPVYERTYQARGEGEYLLGECCLTVSLGEPFQGNCYKLVAAIIPRP